PGNRPVGWRYRRDTSSSRRPQPSLAPSALAVSRRVGARPERHPGLSAPGLRYPVGRALWRPCESQGSASPESPKPVGTPPELQPSTSGSRRPSAGLKGEKQHEESRGRVSGSDPAPAGRPPSPPADRSG